MQPHVPFTYGPLPQQKKPFAFQERVTRDRLSLPTAPPETLPIDHPNSPEYERSAYSAFQTLQNPEKSLPAHLPEDQRQAILQQQHGTLSAYKKARDAHQLPYFPEITREQNAARDKWLDNVIRGPIEDVIPDPTALERFQKMAAFGGDPQRFEDQQRLKSFLDAVHGSPLPPGSFAAFRHAYASQHLGITGEKADDSSAVLNGIRSRMAEDDSAKQKYAQLYEIAYGQVFDPATGHKPEDAALEIATLPERLQPAARTLYATAQREARAAQRRLTPAVDLMEKYAREAQGLEPVTGDNIRLSQTFAALAAILPDDPEDQNLALAMLLARFREDGEDSESTAATTNLASRALAGVGRGFRNMARGSVSAAYALDEAIFTGPFAKEDQSENFTQQRRQQDATQRRQNMEKMRLMEQVFMGEVNPSWTMDDGFLARGLVLGAESAWTLPLTIALPYVGIPLLGVAMGGLRYEEARLTTPEADPGIQGGAAIASGQLEAVAEVAITRVGLRWMQKGIPSVYGILNRAGVQNRLARAVIGGSVAASGTWINEYAEEGIQEGINNVFQDVANELSGLDKAGTDWKQFFKDWTLVFSPDARQAHSEQMLVMAAVMPFALIAGTGASINHFKYADHLRKNKTFLRKLGVPEARIDEIARGTDLEKVSQAFREEAKGIVEKMDADQMADILTFLQTLNEQADAAGLPVITTEYRSPEDPPTHTFHDPVTRETKDFDNEEDAYAHWRERTLAIAEADVEAIHRAANFDYKGHLTAEGQAAETTNINEKKVKASPANAVEIGIATREQIDARVQILLTQQGITPGTQEAAEYLETLAIKARQFVTEARDGSLRYTIDLFRGHDVFDILEDGAESNLLRAINDTFVDPIEILAEVRAFEAANNRRLIDPAYEWSPTNPMPLLEAFSDIARGYAMANIRNEQLPQSLRDWVGLSVMLTAATAQDAQMLSQDLGVAAEIRDAIASGNITPRFRAILEDAIGINEAERMARLEKRYEAQAQAEALGGFPEIRQEASGQLPHPETLRKNNHPLYGEVRRIYDELVKFTARKTKGGDTVLRTNEANAFFLPTGEMVDLDDVRRRLNEKGFAFDTPVDMLDALSGSILYNTPHYGTNSLLDDGQASFALSPLAKPLASANNVQTLRHDKTAWTNAGSSPDGARDIVDKYYHTAAYAGIPRDATLVPMPSTKGTNILPDSLAERIAKDFGNPIEHRPVGVATARKEAKNKRTFFDKEADPVNFQPVLETIDALRGKSVVITEDVHNTGESWIAFANMLIANDIDVVAIATLTSTEQRMTSPRDIERMAEKVAAHLNLPVADVQADLHPLFHETFKQLFNKAEAEITRSPARARKLLDIAQAGTRSGAYRNPLANRHRSQEGILGQAPQLEQDSFSFALSPRVNVTPDANTTEYPGAPGSLSLIGPASFAISAWHGTPHRIDPAEGFRTDKIGTGEGAQAFGYGLYFADSQEVARGYLKAGRNLDILKDSDGKWWATDGSTSIAGPFDTSAEAQSVVDNPGGNLYTVTLKVDNKDLLDWDEKLTSQSAAVQQIAKQLLNVSIPDARARVILNKALKSGGYGPDEIILNIDNDRELYNAADQYTKNRNEDDSPGEALINQWRAWVEWKTLDGHRLYEMMADSGISVDDRRGLSETQREISAALHAAGIRGIRFLDGNSRSQGEGSYNYVIFDAADITITEENGNPVNLGEASYALSPAGINRIEAAIARRINAEPLERAQFYTRVRNRIASITQRLEDLDNGIGPFARRATEDPAIIERRRIQDAIAEYRAIIGTLPAEARGRVPFDMAALTKATTERGRAQALIRLIQQADNALEPFLQAQYHEAFNRLLDLAKPDLRQNKSIRSRITPETQRLVDEIATAAITSPSAANAGVIAANARVDALEAMEIPTDPDALAEWQNNLAEAQTSLDIIETFGALSTRSAAELSHALQTLETIYTRGRTQRRILDDARRSELAAARRQLIEELGPVSQAQWAARTGRRTWRQFIADSAIGLINEHSSFHQVMEWFFPDSMWIRDIQGRARTADRGFTQAIIDAEQRFENFMRNEFGFTGRTARHRWNQMLHDNSLRRDTWNIEIREGTSFERVSLTEEQAAGILDGTFAPGTQWESDIIARESLRQALTDFRMERARARANEERFSRRTIRFQVLKARGNPGPLNMSNLEALYILQLSRQDAYLPALDKHGFTRSVLDAMERGISDHTAAIGNYLAREYASEWSRINPVFQRLYGMDMPRIRNYAPGIFEHFASGDRTDVNLPEQGQQPVSGLNAPFTKVRTQHMARPSQDNALSVYWSHLHATEYFIHWAELLRDMGAVLRAPEVRRTIEGRHGKDAAQLLNQWLKQLEHDGNVRAEKAIFLGRIANNLVATQSAVGLGANVGTLLKQSSAMLGSLSVMPAGEFIRGIHRFLQNPDSFAHVWASPAMQQRLLKGVNPEDRRLLRATAFSPNLFLEAIRLSTRPIAHFDSFFTGIAGTVAYAYSYQQGIDAGLTPEAAAIPAQAHAERVIYNFGQPATTQDKSMAELTAVGMSKFLFLFKSDVRQKLSNSLNAVALAIRGDIGNLEAARRVLVNWVLYGLWEMLMIDIIRSIIRDDDDPENWQLRNYIAAAVAGPVSGIGIVGSAAAAALFGTIGSGSFPNTTNPLDSVINRVATRGFNIRTMRHLTGDKAGDPYDLFASLATDTGGGAFILGAAGLKGAAVAPIALRVARDAIGTSRNIEKAIVGPTTEDIARRTIADFRTGDLKAERDERAASIEDLTQRYADLRLEAPAEAQRLLDAQDSDTRRTILGRLRRQEMSPSERSLAALSKAHRETLIPTILEKLDPEDREAYLERLRSLDLAD